MKEIALTMGQVAIVDDEDYDFLNQWKWHALKKPREYCYYATRMKYIKGSYVDYQMHRVILGLKRGDGMICDHINGNGLDNRRINLRVVNRSQNCMNSRIQKNNTTGFRGVTFNRKAGKYQAQIYVNGRYIYLGMRPTAEAAHRELYVPAQNTYHGEFARS